MKIKRSVNLGYIPNEWLLPLWLASGRAAKRLTKKQYCHKALCGKRELEDFENRLQKSGLLKSCPEYSEQDWREDFMYCTAVYGAGAADYFNLEMYKKTDLAIRGFVTKYMQWHDIVPAFNTDYYAKVNDVLRDKVAFNLKFKDLLHRDFMMIEKGTTLEKFCDFLQGKDKYVAKPYASTCEGDGVVVVYQEQYDTKDKAAALLQSYSKRGIMVEEFLTQKGLVHDMNPLTVNTARIVTMNLNGKVEVVFAALKAGNGDTFVDNICKGGVKMPIDLETGIISGPAVDKDNNYYFYHPYSGIRLIGQELPNWQNVLDVVSCAAQRLPEIPFVGWDVAISDDSVALIEGNQGSSIQDFEFPWENGYASKFAKYEEEKAKSIAALHGDAKK